MSQNLRIKIFKELKDVNSKKEKSTNFFDHIKNILIKFYSGKHVFY